MKIGMFFQEITSIGMFFQEITSITEFSGSNFLIPTIQTASKRDFQMADLLLAIVNFESCIALRVQGIS